MGLPRGCRGGYPHHRYVGFGKTRPVLLYNSPISGNCYKVRLLLAHLGVPYETQFVDAVDRTQKRDELAGLSPTRRVPTLLLDDGRALAESNAILTYFGEGTRFVPGDRYDRAQMFQWMFWEQYEHEPAIAVARFLKTYSGRPEWYEAQRDQLHKRGVKALDAMERHLDAREWFAGGDQSLADIALYAYTHAAGEGGFDLEPYAAIRAWIDRVAGQPGHVPMDA
jgi:glutathione S-transferase